MSAIDLEALRHDLLVDAHFDDRDDADHLLSDGVVMPMTTIALACDALLLLPVWGLRLIGRRSDSAVRVLVPTATLSLVAAGRAGRGRPTPALPVDHVCTCRRGELPHPATGRQGRSTGGAPADVSG